MSYIDQRGQFVNDQTNVIYTGPDFATIILTRRSQFISSALAYEIYIDEQYQGIIKKEQLKKYRVSPGERHVYLSCKDISTMTARSKDLRFSLRPGDTRVVSCWTSILGQLQIDLE